VLLNKVLILCGDKDEKLYFDRYKSTLKGLRNVTVEISIHKHRDPLSLVKEAAKQKTDNKYHEVWAVFDKDEFSQFDEAIACAERLDVEYAFSNRSIEYWFLLHYENYTRAMSQKDLENELSKHLCFKYDKSEDSTRKTCKAIEGNLEDAEGRAKVGHERHQRDSGNSPSNWCSCTAVYRLTKRLREWAAAT